MTSQAKRKIRIEYFAILREQRGLDSEEIESSAKSPRELYERLKESHGFTMQQSQLQVAVDTEFVDWDFELVDNCTVVFIPPVAGG